MELFLERITTKLKILGETLGVLRDTSTSREIEMEKENVVFKWLHHIPSHDLIIMINILNFIFNIN